MTHLLHSPTVTKLSQNTLVFYAKKQPGIKEKALDVVFKLLLAVWRVRLELIEGEVTNHYARCTGN